MSLIKKMRKQSAVYWPKVGIDDQGNTKFGPPIQIKCRWEDVHEEFTDLVGVVKVSNSKVYVDRDTNEGGVLWQGTLSQLDSQTDPFKQKKAYVIQSFSRLPNLKAKEFLLTATL